MELIICHMARLVPRFEQPDWVPRIEQPDWVPRIFRQHLRDTDPINFVVDVTRDADEWSLRVERDGVKVWRRHVPGSRSEEIRGNGLIHAPPRQVIKVMRRSDEETIRKYNPTYESGYDLQEIDANTKVTYGTASRVFPFKPRDTVTRIAFREIPPARLDAIGGSALLLRAVDHAAMPLRPGYVRAKVIRGVTLIQPVAGSRYMTNFTFTQQIDAGGVVPPWILNRLITQDAVQFIKRVGQAAKNAER